MKSVISFNHSARRGGGIFKDGGSDRLGTTISGSTFEGNTADWGGGAVFIWRTPLSVGTTEFLQNQADEYGGALVFQSSGSDAVNIRSCNFEDNIAGMGGGALHFSGEIMNILYTAFLHNSAQNGGAIHQAEITEPTYIGRPDSILVINNSSFNDNIAEINGGGIYNNSTLTLNRGSLAGNKANASGGGIDNLGNILIQDSSFIKNNAVDSGGGLCTEGTTGVIRSTFADNAATLGGGLAFLEGSTALQNDTFSANEAADAGGGIAMIESESSKGKLLASFITMTDNTAPRGGGISINSGTMKIKDSIVAGNLSGGDCDIAGGILSAVAENMDLDGSCAGFTHMEDPQLDALANYGGSTDTHALKLDSPAINAAPDCTNLLGMAVTVDQRSFSRPVGPFCDLGAFEYQQVLPAPSLSTTTPTLTFTPTPKPEEPTVTPEPPSITAIKNANCRYGPGMLYEIADTLMQGQTALVVGRNEDNTWWQIEGPRFGTLCWVAHTIVEENGPVEGVPIGVAPPEPTLTLEPQTGCYIYNEQREKVCVVPCPANARSLGTCSP
jgi:hypothetical protein